MTSRVRAAAARASPEANGPDWGPRLRAGSGRRRLAAASRMSMAMFTAPRPAWGSSST